MYNISIWGEDIQFTIELPGEYRNGLAAVDLREADGSPLARLSVNLTSAPAAVELAKSLTNNEQVGFIAKLWSENQPYVKLLDLPCFEEVMQVPDFGLRSGVWIYKKGE